MAHRLPNDVLPADFCDRLEQALQSADRKRRARAWHKRLLSLLPVLLLLGPVVAWSLTESTVDGVHVAIGALAWVTFLLDVGVHLDTTLLSYLGLSELPTLVGAAILLILTFWFLSDPGEGR